VRENFIAQLRDEPETASDRFGSLLGETNQQTERFGQGLKQTKIFLFNADDRGAYHQAVRTFHTESTRRVDAAYAQLLVAYENGFFGEHGRPPPPPPGYRERLAQNAAQAGQTAGSANPQPGFNPNDQARRSEAANNAEAARAYREAAEQADDPETKRIFLERAEELENQT
jgi:hypothetical protein